MATNVNETERLKGLLREWLDRCGVYQTLAGMTIDDGPSWKCYFCEAGSVEGPNRIVHAPDCIVGRTLQALAECEAGKKA